MTPAQAYAQWKGVGARPYETESQTIRRFTQQFGLKPEDEEELLKAYPDRPQLSRLSRSWDDSGRREKKSGFLSQTFGAGADELQKSFGSAIAGPGAEVLSDLGWEGGAGFLEDIGTDIVEQQEEDLKEYEAPQTRDELIKEGGFWGALYENILPEETQTPQQLGRSALPSLGAAGIALGAAGVTALATGGNPWAVGAVAMAVGNAVGSFQVGGEEFESAKRDPFIRKQLGIDPDADFADLTPEQQRALTDSAQRVAKDTMVERLYTSGALESLAFIPYGPLALRYIADIALGATSEELDKRLGMENTLEELERLGVTREEIPELREKIKALRPGTFETVWNAAIMEATFGAPTAVIETVAQTDARVDRRLTAASEKRKILKERINKAVSDPLKLEKAKRDLRIMDTKIANMEIDQQIKIEEGANKLADSELKSDLSEAERLRKETEGTINDPSSTFTNTVHAKAETTPEIPSYLKTLKPSKRGRKTRSESIETLNQQADATDANLNDYSNNEFIEDDLDVLSMDRIMHQVAINELNEVFEGIDFRGAKLGKDEAGNVGMFYETHDGELGVDTEWRGTEGFVEDITESEYAGANPIVYISQRMFRDGQLLRNTEEALSRMGEVAFHEALGHAGLRKLLNAGTAKTDGSMEWTGDEYNQFIKKFDNRHRKMVDRWLKITGRYAKPPKDISADAWRFRQVEEFIASNFGESGGGKTLGFFDNTAILIREALPFAKNSLNQYQVAKTIQQVADEYATGLKGKAPKKGNLLTGVELVGAISRAATEAKIPEERTGEGITLEYAERTMAEEFPPALIEGEAVRDVPIEVPVKEKSLKEKLKEEKAIKRKEERKRLDTDRDRKRASDPKTRGNSLVELAKNPDEGVRRLVALNIRTPEETLATLEKDESKLVRDAVKQARKEAKKITKEADKVRRKNLKATEKTKASKEKEEAKILSRMEKAINPETSMWELRKLADDPNTDVRRNVALNRRSAKTILEKLSKDKKKWVAGPAMSRLQGKGGINQQIETQEKKIKSAEDKIKELRAERKKIWATKKSERKKSDQTKLEGTQPAISKQEGIIKEAQKKVRTLSKSEQAELTGELGFVGEESKEGKNVFPQKLGMAGRTFEDTDRPWWAANTRDANKVKGVTAWVNYLLKTSKTQPTLEYDEIPRKKGETTEAYLKRFDKKVKELRKKADKPATLEFKARKGLPTVGININDSTQPFTEQILSGRKTIETRNSDSLRKYVGKRVGIIKTGEGPAQVVGYVTIAEPIVYKKRVEFRRDQSKHLIKAGSDFDMAEGQDVKYGYPLMDIEKVTPFPVTSQGIVSRKITQPTTPEVTGYVLTPEGKYRRATVAEQEGLPSGATTPTLTVGGTPMRAEPWEIYEMGIRSSDEEKEFIPKQRTQAMSIKIRRNLAADELADLDLARKAITGEATKIKLYEDMLKLTGDERLKPKGYFAVKKGIRESKKNIEGWKKFAIEAERKIQKKLDNALKTITPLEQEVFFASTGLHDTYGELSNREIVMTILAKHPDHKMKFTEEKNPNKYLLRKEVEVHRMIKKASKRLSGEDIVPETSSVRMVPLEPEDQSIYDLRTWALEGGYTGETKGTTRERLRNEEKTSEARKVKLWNELKPFNKKTGESGGRLSFDNVKADKDLKAERNAKARELYQGYGIVAQTFAADKENVQKNWSVNKEDLAWAKKNGWKMETNLAEEKLTEEGEKFQEALDVLRDEYEGQDFQIVDQYTQDVGDAIRRGDYGEADRLHEIRADEWLADAEAKLGTGLSKSEANIVVGNLSRSIVPFNPVSAVTKFNKLQNWVYSLFGPTRSSLNYTRLALKRSREDKAKAMPANRHKKVTLPNGSVFYVGKNKTTDQWIEQVESVLSDKEILDAKDWYPQIIPIFEKTFGKKDAPKMIMAWALANKGESPLGAMRNILKVGQNLENYLKEEFVKKGGLAHDNIVKVLREEAITGGAGVKLFDFLDASVGMDFRSVAGFDASMGAPAVVDRHTWRDFGYIDDVVLKYLTTALPNNKTLKNLVVDRKKPTVIDTEYELVADWLRKMANDLNTKNWKGRSDWKPRDVQAVGWMGITEALPSEGGGTPAQMISETSRTLAFELDFGEGSPLSKRYGATFNNEKIISPLEKERITYEVGDLIADIALKKTGVKQTERIRGYGYYRDYGANPNIILKISATDPAVADIMDVIGLLAQQTGVIAFGPKNKARGVGFDFRDKGNKLQNKDVQDAFYNGLREAFPNYIEGASQTTIDGRSGLRIVLNNVKAKSGNAKEISQNVSDLGAKIEAEMQPTLKKLAEDLGLDLELDIFQAETFYAENDFTQKESKNGELYKQRINSRFRSEVSRRIIDNDTARVEQKIKAEIEKSKPQETKPKAKELKLDSGFLLNLGNASQVPAPRITKSQATPINRSRSNQAINSNHLGGRWSGFWLRQIKKLRPLSKIKGRAEFLKLRQIAFGQMTQWQVFSKSVFDALKNSKQTKEVYKYLTTPNANSSIITDPVERVAAEKAKRAIEKIGKTLVARKLMKASTLKKFKQESGDYLPRVYLKHLLDDKDHTKIAMGLKPSSLDYLKNRRDIPKGVRELILGELTDQHGAPALLASRALMVPGKDLAIMNWMQKMKDMSIQQNLGWVLKNQFVSFNTLEEARKIINELDIPNGAVVMKELELDVDLSEMVADVTPAWLTAESEKLGVMAKNLQGSRKKIVDALRTKMMDVASDMEDIVGSAEGVKDYRQIPNSARYGSLRGMWVHKQIADDIIGGMKVATGEESNWEKWVGETGKAGQYNAYWKWAKVAANPPSWARNFISNNVLLTLAGVPFWSIPRLNLAALKEIRTKGKYYQIALRQGVMAGNMTEAELGRMETEFKEVQIKMGEGGNMLDWIQLMFGKTMDKGSKFYGGIETLGKIGAIKYAMEKQGMNEADAASFANKWLFDYGLVTPSIRYASTAIVGAPFIRFQANAIPLMFEVMLTKPWRMVPYYALAYGFVEAFKDNHDLDEEQYEAAKKSLSEWLQEKAMGGLLPPNILPLPALDDQGRWQIYDLSYLMPWGMISEVSGEVWNGEFASAMQSVGLMGGPVADLLAALKTGTDSFTRKPITDDLKPWSEQMGDWLWYAINMSTPSMLHSDHGAIPRLARTAMGELDPKTGRPKYTGTQATLRLIGQNIYPTDLVEQRKINIRRLTWEIGNLRADFRRQMRGLKKQKASLSDIQEARAEFKEREAKLLKERRDYIRASKVPRSLRA